MCGTSGEEVAMTHTILCDHSCIRTFCRGLVCVYRYLFYLILADKHTVSTGLQKSKKEVAGASVPVGSREAMSITSFSVVETATAGHQEQCGTELPSDQWRVSTCPCVILYTHCY